MLDVVRALVRHEEAERRRHQLADVFEGAWTERAEEGLQFGERLFDRIEVRTVGWQESQLGSGLLDRHADFGLFVRGEVVEDDDIATSQHRHQDLLDVRAERVVVDRSIEDGRGGQLRRPQRGHHGVRLPMAAGRVIGDAHAPRTACVATQQIGGDTGFIHKHVLAGVVDRKRRAPSTTIGRDIRATLFVSVYGFF